MSVTAGVVDATRKRLGGGKRYWPGKAPEWADEAEEDHEDDVLDRAFPKRDGFGVATKDDSRLRRLAHCIIESREEVRADHRRVRHAVIISTEEDLRNQETRDEEEDEDAVEERRRRIRDKNLKRVQEEAALPLVEEDEEEQSEYETDSEDEIPGITMIKPVFVQKAERDTVGEREWLEAEEEALEELAKRKLKMRKTETKQIVVEEVRKDEEIIRRMNMLLEEASIGDLEAEEYQAWKTREIARTKRERCKGSKAGREFRNTTEQERKNLKP